MGYKIVDIEGIGSAYAEKLDHANIKTTDDLLELCCSKKGRSEIAEKTGVSEKLLLGWANKADLMRISGIGSEYADLLEASGVDTVKELRNRNADNLATKMAEINEAKSLTRAIPSAKVVGDWISKAGEIDPLISH